jgi:CubicO group peptidase (beta-lactamase class C family)
VDAAVLENMEKQQAVGATLGVAVGVIQNGRVVYLNGYGFADRKKQTLVTAKTLFRWASIFKVLTGVAALQLSEQGKLDLDRDVRDYVPDFPDKGATITARDILRHQSGIPHYISGKVVVTPGHYVTEHPFEDVVVALDKFKESPLLFSPGEKVSYSSYDYILLSAVLQRAGKEKFADQIKEGIAAPLGLKTLQPDYQWLENPERASGYEMRGAR